MNLSLYYDWLYRYLLQVLKLSIQIIMPPYKHYDNIYLSNIIKMMEQHMHKQLFRNQREMYITVFYGRDLAELQMSWHDYLSNQWCYAKFPFVFKGTNALYIYIYIYIYMVPKSFNTSIRHYTMQLPLENHPLLTFYYRYAFV